MTIQRRLPAEWEKTRLLFYRFRLKARLAGKYHAVKWAFMEIIRKVTAYEPVILV
jgi:agmatine/peptidylarginine deiminase